MERVRVENPFLKERAAVRKKYQRKVRKSNHKLEVLGDSAAVTAMLDRLLHHGHVLKCGPRSWRTKTDLPDQEKTV